MVQLFFHVTSLIIKEIKGKGGQGVQIIPRGKIKNCIYTLLRYIREKTLISLSKGREKNWFPLNQPGIWRAKYVGELWKLELFIEAHRYNIHSANCWSTPAELGEEYWFSILPLQTRHCSASIFLYLNHLGWGLIKNKGPITAVLKMQWIKEWQIGQKQLDILCIVLG